jgi:hypothetical protein
VVKILASVSSEVRFVFACHAEALCVTEKICVTGIFRVAKNLKRRKITDLEKFLPDKKRKIHKFRRCWRLIALKIRDTEIFNLQKF